MPPPKSRHYEQLVRPSPTSPARRRKKGAVRLRVEARPQAAKRSRGHGGTSEGTGRCWSQPGAQWAPICLMCDHWAVGIMDTGAAQRTVPQETHSGCWTLSKFLTVLLLSSSCPSSEEASEWQQRLSWIAHFSPGRQSWVQRLSVTRFTVMRLADLHSGPQHLN